MPWPVGRRWAPTPGLGPVPPDPTASSVRSGPTGVPGDGGQRAPRSRVPGRAPVSLPSANVVTPDLMVST